MLARRFACCRHSHGVTRQIYRASCISARSSAYNYNRPFSTGLILSSDDRSSYRNVSFWGHIDAGKTTLTERVLYLAKALSPPSGTSSGSKSSSQLPGDVDSGSTVTDFLEAERQRGITIQSAAVGPFKWAPSEPLKGVPVSNISLIDTPGHIDFTIEVERSLRVADGCVVLIDGVEGVESQTENVWQIAQRYNIRSHVVFVNKLDRVGASLAASVGSIVSSGMHVQPTILQLPIYSFDSSSTQEATLIGVIDLTSLPLQAHFYGGRAGEDIESLTLQEAIRQRRVPESLYAEAERGRESLVEVLGSLDEEILNRILDVDESSNDQVPHKLVTTHEVRSAIRRLTIQGEILPVLCGSAHKGVGIQSVLDAVNRYLPSPGEAGDISANQDRNLSGGCVWGNVEGERADQTSRVSISLEDAQLSLLAFKVVWDKQKGPITYVRVYSGTLTRASTLFNTTTQTKERLSKILFAYADRFIESDSLQAGQVGVLLGFRDTRTGDTLVDARVVKTRSSKSSSWASKSTSLRLRRVDVPLPVFSMSLEPLGKSDEGQVREAVEMLIRTDPSLRIDYGDSDDGSAGLGAAGTGQIVLSGMGELHLEIAKDRLENEFHARAVMGNVRVSYRETLKDTANMTAEATSWHTEELDRDVMGKKLKASCEIGIRCGRQDEISDENVGGNIVKIDLASSSASDSTDVSGFDSTQVRLALEAGVIATLSRGPLTHNAMMGMHITIRNLETFGPQVTTLKALTIVASQGVHKAVKARGLAMMEPVMKVRIDCDEQYLGKVSSVLASEQSGIVERVDHEASSVAPDGTNNASSVYLPAEEEGSMKDEHRRKNVACTIYATVPLVKLVNYSSKLRAITKGSGTFEMALQGFTLAGPEREKEILSELGRIS
jgi:elongation factor G